MGQKDARIERIQSSNWKKLRYVSSERNYVSREIFTKKDLEEKNWSHRKIVLKHCAQKVRSRFQKNIIFVFDSENKARENVKKRELHALNLCEELLSGIHGQPSYLASSEETCPNWRKFGYGVVFYSDRNKKYLQYLSFKLSLLVQISNFGL